MMNSDSEKELDAFLKAPNKSLTLYRDKVIEPAIINNECDIEYMKVGGKREQSYINTRAVSGRKQRCTI